jgi:hypothetical protein
VVELTSELDAYMSPLSMPSINFLMLSILVKWVSLILYKNWSLHHNYVHISVWDCDGGACAHFSCQDLWCLAFSSIEKKGILINNLRSSYFDGFRGYCTVHALVCWPCVAVMIIDRVFVLNFIFIQDYMGRCILTLTRVILEGEYKECFQLDEAKSGRLNLHLKWTPQHIYRDSWINLPSCSRRELWKEAVLVYMYRS